jgi:nitrogen fixation NifU-like protein
MMDLRALYQELIMDHNRNPRNHRVMPEANHVARGFNPLCGDQLTVYVQMVDSVVVDISFLGCGCAISQASASLMTDAVLGKTCHDAHALFQQFHSMVTSDAEVAPSIASDKLFVLAGVRGFPARVKCATLAWHTLESALNKQSDTVVTE